MSNNIFRIFNPKGPKEDPIEKRRGQLRRAQKNFRERKDKYTKTLESELAKCRANEARLMHEAESLRTTVKVLAQLLSEHGIESPASVLDALHQMQPPAQESQFDVMPIDSSHYAGNSQSPVETAQWTSPESSTGYSGSESQSNYTIQQQYRPQPQVPKAKNSFTDILREAMPLQSQTGRCCDFDIVNIGMEFVLTLERPCLGHIHGDPSKPNEPSGHALTTSAVLLSTCPSQSPNDLTPSFQNAPAALLDRLLTLSPSLSPDGEMTPVQAWNYIRRQPLFGGLNTRDLWALTGELREAVKCHGFGAVIQQGTFENLVYKTLLVGRAP
ncbi:hypothetical protein BGZ63DRAFT_390550 [Mariannaea sp. PMI_226]|nr:hypothetical protein BGZ63DRAFT_390550 [Mariannaea sp. PMI_226]